MIFLDQSLVNKEKFWKRYERFLSKKLIEDFLNKTLVKFLKKSEDDFLKKKVEYFLVEFSEESIWRIFNRNSWRNYWGNLVKGFKVIPKVIYAEISTRISEGNSILKKFIEDFPGKTLKKYEIEVLRKRSMKKFCRNCWRIFWRHPWYIFTNISQKIFSLNIFLNS